MTLSAIGSSSPVLSTILGIPSKSDPSLQAGDGGTQVAAGTSGRFSTAIVSAFASIGVTLDGSTASATTSSATAATAATASTDSADPLSSFLQSLFAALHSQSGAAAGSTPPPAATDGSNAAQSPAVAATTSSSTVGRAHHAHGGHLARDLQSLITELSSATTTDGTATTDPATTSTASTATTDPSSASSALSTLEQRFDALLAGRGVAASGSGALTTFLQSLASSLHGAPATGNVVSTTV